MVGGHSCLKEIQAALEKLTDGASFDFDQEVAVIITKIEAGRYRSPQLFLNDLKYVLEVKLVKKALTVVTDVEEKDRINIAGKGLLLFLKDKLEPKLEL